MIQLTIGKVAKQAGLSIETVRFYERQGLIDPPPRKDSNYRQYPEETVSRLRFIKRAKKLGFSLKEIQELLALRHDPQSTKADIKQQAESKLDNIQEKIHDLQRMQNALKELVAACDGHGPVDECPIIEALETNEDE